MKRAHMSPSQEPIEMVKSLSRTQPGSRKKAEPRLVQVREHCMFPGCARPRVEGYAYVHGRGRVPLCREHLAGRESP